MEDGIRNLLAGIGQPDFSYRNFDQADQSELIGKWPLMALVMPQARVPDAAPGRNGVRSPTSVRAIASARIDSHGNVVRPGFLDNYQASARPAAAPGGDVRSLLARLSDDLT